MAIWCPIIIQPLSRLRLHIKSIGFITPNKRNRILHHCELLRCPKLVVHRLPQKCYFGVEEAVYLPAVQATEISRGHPQIKKQVGHYLREAAPTLVSINLIY